MKQPLTWINGSPGTSIAVADRALQYGDGVFETLRVMQGKPRFLERHLARLQAGCERLRMVQPDTARLRDEILQLAGQTDEGILKVIVSRGTGARGYAIGSEQGITRILSLHPTPDWPQDYKVNGIRMRICDLRLCRQPALAGIKHLNRLEQILARSEWTQADIQEGLLLDQSEHVIEGTMSNLFVVHDSVLLTPDLSACGVAGILRSVVLDLAARMGIEVRVQPLALDELGCSREVFVCNSVIGIWPVVRIDGHGEFPIGSLTRRLGAELEGHDHPQRSDWYSS